MLKISKKFVRASVRLSYTYTVGAQVDNYQVWSGAVPIDIFFVPFRGLARPYIRTKLQIAGDLSPT